VTTRSGLPDEAELHAYADGQLPAERIGAVEGWLAGDAEARDRLASWRAQNELIVRLYDSPVEPSTAAWLGHRLEQRTRGWRQCRFWGDHVTHVLVEARHSHRLFWLRMISLVGS
jgi:anti-sigma factor RsiW